MTDQDRGAYTPQTDAPLAFDARRSRGASSGPAPLTLVISAVVLLLLIIALLLFYRSGVRGAGQPPQVVGAPIAQTKGPPSADAANASGAPALQVYRSEATPPSEPKTPTFTPAPEEPAPRPSPTVPVQTAPAPSVTAPPTPLRPAQTEANPPPAEPASSAADSTAHLPPTIPAPVAKAAKPTLAKSPPVGAPIAGAPVAGEPLVQIGAFTSAALAEKGWRDTAALSPGRMTGRTAKVEKTVRADGKIFYRSFVGGFASHAQAQAFCDALKAAGKTCIVR